MPAVADSPTQASAPKTVSVKGVEIFAVGEHREGSSYTAADLDQIVKNFEQFQAELHPTLVVGHEEDQSFLTDSGYPAAGSVSRVWRDGDVLKADFADVPPLVARLIESRTYRTVSSEIYDDYQATDGKSYGKALRRVAALGAELPQVKTIAELPEKYFGEGVAEFCAAPVHRRAVLKYMESKPGSVRGTFQAFSEVRIMAKRQKLEKFSDRCKATFAKFAAEAAIPDQAAPPPAGVSHDDLVAMLTEMGMDPGILDGIKDDNQLAEIVRMCKSQGAAMMGEQPQPGVKLAEPPPPVPVPTPTPAPSPTPAIPGVPNATPSQVTLKFGEQPVDITKIVNDAVAAALAPIQGTLAAAKQDVDKFQETARKDRIDSKWAEWLKAGKVIPAQEEAIKGRLRRANAVQKFADGLTELEKQLAEIDAYPNILKFSETVKSNNKGVVGGGGSTDEEVNRVQAFSETSDFTRVLAATGKSGKQWVNEFKEAQKKRPDLTAEQFGVPKTFSA